MKGVKFVFSKYVNEREKHLGNTIIERDELF